MNSNMFPIKFDFDSFNIQRIKNDEGLLSSLRERYNSTHSFFKRGDFIYISPGVINAKEFSNLEMLSIKDNSEIVQSLIKHIFFRAFIREYPSLIASFDPVTFSSSQPQHNLINNLFQNSELQKKISYKKTIEIHFKYFQNQANPLFYAVINNRYKWQLDTNCEDLLHSGFDLNGLDVQKIIYPPYSQTKIGPTLVSIGRVISNNGKTADVETNFGTEVVNLNELTISKTYDNLKLFLSHHLGIQKAEEVMGIAKEREFISNTGEKNFKETENVGRKLCELEYKNFDGFVFRIENNNSIIFQSLDLSEPNYLFSVSLSKSHTSPGAGLNKFGPYDHAFFEASKPNILAIYHKNSAGIFTQFLAQLRDGIPSSNGKRSYFENGMHGKYGLRELKFKAQEINNYNVSEYLRVVKDNLEQDTDFVICETLDEFRKLPIKDNPYFVIKSFLLSLGIPVQFIKSSKAKNPFYIIDSFALQSYAKLGGTPWALPSNPNIAHEIIVGVGHNIIKANKYVGSEQNRVVGITTFFSSDGQYLFTNKTKEIPYENYFNDLLGNLKDSIDQISKNYSWKNGDIVRIIFHVFKPMKDREIEVFHNLVALYPQFDIKFSFVSFSDNHPILFFEKENNSKKPDKGRFIPSRGYNVVLNDFECLIQLTGFNEIKTNKHKQAIPLLIKIHQESTYRDLNTIVQQIFRFTHLSFRSFFPSQLPVTLLYATLIAEQMHKLSKIEGWNPDAVNRLLKNKKWFL